MGSRALGLRQLEHVDSVIVAPGLWSTGSIVGHQHSSFTAYGISPDQGLNPCLLLALTGGFLTIEPPGKPDTLLI